VEELGHRARGAAGDLAEGAGGTDLRRGRGRRDPLRASVVLWGGWWLVLAVFFSGGTFINSYYVAALVPAVAALCGTGIAACGPGPWRP
jgi:4-amino-4-deoxy-L-arabinose transferase-like glycosyltransferase